MTSLKLTGNSKIIGKGVYGIVYEALFHETRVAVKRISLTLIKDKKVGEIFLNGLDHQNVIQLFSIQEDTDFRYYVMELCKASLEKLFLKDDDPEKYNGPTPLKIDVMLQLAKGLEYTHKTLKANISLIHRDLNPGNALIWTGRDRNGLLQVLMKWGDLGLSKQLVNERGSPSVNETNSTNCWLAPEDLVTSEDDTETEEKKLAVKRDVFVTGLVFGYFLLNGSHPFGSTKLEVGCNILQNKPTNLKAIKSKSAVSLIKNMLQKQPEKRMTSARTVEELEKLKIKFINQDKTLICQCKGEMPNFKTIKRLLTDNIDVNNHVDQIGSTPLLVLLSRNNQNSSLFEIVQQFIESGADVNHVNRHGRNALHYLCKNYRKDDIIDIAQLFIKQKIDVDCVDNEGQTALSFLPSNSTDAIREVRQLIIDHEHKKEIFSHGMCSPLFSPERNDFKIEKVHENGSDTDGVIEPLNKKVKRE